MISSVGVFCGSKPGDSPRFLEAASAFGRALVENQLDLVYGGAHLGVNGSAMSQNHGVEVLAAPPDQAFGD